MNLLFIGIEPSKDLVKALLANAISFDAVKKLPTRGEYDLIAYAPSKSSQIDHLESIKERWPLAWIAIVVSQKWLQSEDILPEILRRPEKNELWLLEAWENTFWVSLQQAIQNRKNKLQLQTLKAEVRNLRRHCDELTEHSQMLVTQLQKNVDLAGALQQSLLPKVAPEIAGISIATKYLPAAGPGGDYYDIFEYGDKKRFGILLADSKTHGMAASLLSVLLKVRLDEMKDRFPDSKSFVEYLNHEIRQTHKKTVEPLSLFYGVLDRSSLTFQYTISGQMKPLLWRAGEKPILPLASAPSLGSSETNHFQENTFRLLPGDLLILHTDGLQAPLQGDVEARIIQILAAKDMMTPRELQNELMGLIDRHLLKTKLKDDLTLIQLGIHERTMYLAPVASLK